MPALLQQGVDLGQLGPHPLRDGLALDPETAVLRLPTDVGEAEEIERLGLADTPGRSLPGSVLPELDQAGLVRMQLQVELPEPFAKIGEEPLRIGLILETGDKVVREAHEDHVSTRVAASPLRDPQVQDVVQVHVGEQRRGRCPLWCALVTGRPGPVFDDPCAHPLADKPQDPFVRDPVLDKPL